MIKIDYIKYYPITFSQSIFDQAKDFFRGFEVKLMDAISYLVTSGNWFVLH